MTIKETCVKAKKVKRKEVDPKGIIKYLDIGGIDNSTNKIVSHKDFTWSAAPSRAQQIVKVGDTLFSTVRTYLKNIAQVKKHEYDGEICSSGFTVLRGRLGLLDPDYLFYFSLSEQFLRPLNKLQTGSSYPAVRDKDVFSQKIPVPPLPEQRAIVAKLEALLGALDRSKAELEVARAKLGVYRQSVLKEAFGGRLTGSENGFESVSLKSIASEIRNGVSTKPNGGEKDVKILRISAARPMQLNLYDHRFIKEEDAKLDKSKLERGDLLFTRYNGSRNYVGVGGVFNSDELYTYPDKLIRVRLNQEFALPRFVMYAVNSGDSRQFLEQRIRTTAGQSGISGRDLKQTPIPLPSLPEQHQIVAEIESRFSVADALEREIVGALERVEGVRMGVLKRAFGGELLNEEELTELMIIDQK